MMILAVWIELTDDVPVQGAHRTYPSEHRGPAGLHNEDRCFHRSLPLRRVVLGFRKLGNVVAGILQRDQPPAVRQRDGIVKSSLLARDPPQGYLAFRMLYMDRCGSNSSTGEKLVLSRAAISVFNGDELCIRLLLARSLF
jgi:hypothetical protein